MVEKEQTIVPQIYEDIDMRMNRECFVYSIGENCFVLDMDSMYVDTIRFNLLRVHLKGSYNPSLNGRGVAGVNSKFFVYKNGIEYTNLSLAAFSNSLSNDRWSSRFNYGNFAGYDSLKAQVSMRCIIIREENGQEIRVEEDSKYTDLFTFIP